MMTEFLFFGTACAREPMQSLQGSACSTPAVAPDPRVGVRISKGQCLLVSMQSTHCVMSGTCPVVHMYMCPQFGRLERIKSGQRTCPLKVQEVAVRSSTIRNLEVTPSCGETTVKCGTKGMTFLQNSGREPLSVRDV